jgi:hypothetical protein
MITSPMAPIPESALRLLDFIGRAETGRTGADAYRTVIGFHEGDLPGPITSLSVDELLASQEEWPARGWVTTAAGKYQILRSTLLDLKVALSLSGREVFDEGLQDRLGYALLERCGWPEVQSGMIRRRDFALAVAREWAAIPVLRGTQGRSRRVRRGQSFYAGDGRNTATITPKAFEAALDDVLGASVVRKLIELFRRWGRGILHRQTS